MQILIAIFLLLAQVRPGGKSGASAVALQPNVSNSGVATNPLQQGNIQLNGNIILGTNPSAAYISKVNNGFGPGNSVLYLGGSNPVAIQGGSGFAFYPSAFNSLVADTQSLGIFRLYGNYNNSPLITTDVDRTTTDGAIGPGFVHIALSGCGDGLSFHAAPCLTTVQNNGEATPLYLGGQQFNNTGKNKVVVTTGPTNVTSGNLFEVLNAGVLETGVSFNGTLTTAVPIPQTSGGTGAGTLNCAGAPLTSNGTVYSCSTAVAGTIIRQIGVNPANGGTLLNGSLCTTTGALPFIGAAVSNTCAISPRTPFGILGLTVFCEVTSNGNYQIRWCNTGTNDVTIPGNTYDVSLIQ